MVKRKDPVAEFDALSDFQKEQIWRELDQLSTEEIKAKSRPLNADESELWRRFKRKAGRPKIGKGVKVVSIGVEKDLLKRADALARRRGVNRSALVAEALKALIASAT